MIFGEIPIGLFIDHKNGIRSDNWLGNLRLATSRQNQHNKLSQKDTSSKYKGVWWDAKKNYWKASFRFENKRVYLGQFNTELEAAAAYDSHAKQVHGEYAKLNLV
jgi:uncharacterized protein YigA (DUF484 family)